MILIVDDDDDVRAMIKRALHELGYPAIEAEGGATALALLADNKIDLVILDYMMPGMDGTEVARRIGEIDPGLPIIFSTGHSALRTLRNAAGEDVSVLEKPFALSARAALITEKLSERPRAVQ